jgi:predicted dehydrogenase
VYLFGSAQLHYEYGMIALQAGKHLFVEKPVAPSYLQARALAAAAQTNGLVAVGGHNRRFFKSLAAVRARLCFTSQNRANRRCMVRAHG